MLLEPGEKIHVAMRRLAEDEPRRHFVGEIKTATDAAARVEGYSFLFEPGKNQFVRRNERRERIISLTDARNLITLLPGFADIDKLHYAISPDRRVVLTDGDRFKLEINEFGPGR